MPDLTDCDTAAFWGWQWIAFSHMLSERDAALGCAADHR